MHRDPSLSYKDNMAQAYVTNWKTCVILSYLLHKKFYTTSVYYSYNNEL